MKLNSQEYKDLQTALLSAFPNKTTLRQMVRFQLDENLDAIVGGETLEAVIFNLIEVAQSKGKLSQLITGAYQENPDNPELKAFYQKQFSRTVNPIQPSSLEILTDNRNTEKLINILHLSDLHFNNFQQAQIWSNQLAEDLRNDLNIPHLDALILSGDIANYSTPEEYQAAEKFFANLLQDFPLKPEQIIIVPGNHDLNWKISEEDGYTPMLRKKYSGLMDETLIIDDGGNYIAVIDPRGYQQRFINFSKFYEAIKNQPYPLEYSQQYTLDYLSSQNILILGLNSAWQLDHHYKFRASINMDALSNALTAIRRHPEYKNCIKIAVWHHPLDSVGNDRIKDTGFMEQLAVAGFRFFLHGHVHKAETSLYRYDMSKDGRKLDRICAGTFGAATKELIPAYPWQYNLLQFTNDKLTVRTRRREEENGAWKPDARWGQGAGKSSLDFYDLDL